MKVLIVVLLLSRVAIFAEVLSKATIDAYATSISGIFDSKAQEAIEEAITPVLGQINPAHAKDTVKQTKLAVQKYKGPVNASFVAGMIVALDAANTQAHDVESALASAVLAPSDAPIANDNAGSVHPADTTSALVSASADNSSPSAAPAGDIAAADTSMPTPMDSAGQPSGVDSNTLTPLTTVDPTIAPLAPTDHNAMLHSPPAIYPEAAFQHVPAASQHHSSAGGALQHEPGTEHHASAASPHHASAAANHTSGAVAHHESTTPPHNASATANHTSGTAAHHGSAASTHHSPAPIGHKAPLSRT